MASHPNPERLWCPAPGRAPQKSNGQSSSGLSTSGISSASPASWVVVRSEPGSPPNVVASRLPQSIAPPSPTSFVFAFNSYSAPGVPREPFIDRAWTAALVLIIIVLVLNLVARLVARVFAPKTR